MTKSIDVKAVLFDLDGTLLDTAPDFSFVLDTMMAHRQRPPVPYEQVRETVSDGARALVQLAFGLTPEHAEFEPLRQELLTLYAKHLADNTKPFAGIDALLHVIESAQMQWGIVTNKPVLYAAPILTALALEHRCRVLVCPDHVTRRKPDPEPLLIACEKLQCTPAEAVYIGDHRRDIECGLNAGMFTIACRWGYIHPNDPCEAWGADLIVDHPEQITALLQQPLPQIERKNVNA